MPPGQRRLAERRVLTTLGRIHRREPMLPDVRTDVLIDTLRAEDARPGASVLPLSDAELLSVVDELVARGELVRAGRRIRLPAHRSRLGPQMRERADRLLEELAAHGASPPRADAVARRLGLPPGVVDALRQSGELVELGEGIDYPRSVLDVLLERLAGRPLSVAAVRDELGTTRRFAAALVEAARVRPGR